MRQKWYWFEWLLFSVFFIINFAEAGPAKVGNGDDGSDLEGAVKIKTGPVWKARNEAVKVLTKLNTAGVSGLGQLIPEQKKIYTGQNGANKKTDPMDQ